MSAADPIVQAVAEALITHTRLGIKGKCHCGHVVPLGRSFAAHQAEHVVAAVESFVAAREAAARKAGAVEALLAAATEDIWHMRRIYKGDKAASEVIDVAEVLLTQRIEAGS